MTFGFLLVFLIAGVISVVFAAVLGKAVDWIALTVGLGFTVLGILMLFGKNGFSFHIGGNWNRKQGTMISTFLYGIAYGLADFLLYAAGMGFVVTIISLCIDNIPADCSRLGTKERMMDGEQQRSYHVCHGYIHC